MFITIASLVVHMAFLQRIITPSSSPAIILYRVYVRNSGIHIKHLILINYGKLMDFYT